MISLFSNTPKVFCVGLNKTGTTSMGELLTSLGYKLAPQEPAEMMIEDWSKRDFTNLINFCKKYNAFQDIPFSLPYTFQALDIAFPKSKFILTVRSSPDEWFESWLRFTKKRLNLDRAPQWSDLEKDLYRYKGFIGKCFIFIFGSKINLFDKDEYTRFYTFHNDVIEYYFRFRPQDFLKVNLGSTNSLEEILYFLGIQKRITSITLPHLNKS